ncbi:uncharacterized protein LOC110704711 [Chenopodium quinoa]|uniref:uncharacterized protein LOC110704711 n=1 Tax=Chenopodium quinoa TaxID=63459 RepID=UPI000B76EB3B|nr:uncharacterized protein LOC110704711 [Chenopodium quinoa]
MQGLLGRPENDAPHCPSVVSNEQGRASGAFPTERRAALPRPGCSDKYARVAGLSPGSDAPHCLSVVSNDQGLAVGDMRECGMREHGRKDSSLRIGSWNVGSLTGKSAEVVEVMKRRRVNSMCLQETRWTGEGARGLVLGYKVWYVGQETSHKTRNGGSRNGVGVILDERLSKECIRRLRVRQRQLVDKRKKRREVYEKLDSKEGEKIIYKMTKRRQEARKDIGMVKYVKDKNQIVLVQEEDIKDRWKRYFDELFNVNNGVVTGDTSMSDEEINMEYVRRIRRVEVEITLKKMKPKKGVDPDGISTKVWRCLGNIGIDWLTDLFNKIWRATRIPQNWRKSTLVQVYKNKGDAQDCSNYRGIKLMSHTMKLWERVIEHRLRACTRILDNQFGFMPGRLGDLLL